MIPETKLREMEQKRGQKAAIAAALALAVGLLCTLFAAAISWREIEAQARLRFDRNADSIATETQRRISQTIYGLKGARGLYAALDHVTRAQFNAYMASRNLPQEFPGAVGIGFMQRDAGIQSKAPTPFPLGDATPALQLEHLRTAALQQSATWADAFHLTHLHSPGFAAQTWETTVGEDPRLRTAMVDAVLSGEPRMTPCVDSIAATNGRCVCWCFLPVYRHGAIPDAPQLRSDELLGLLCAPIVIQDAMRGVVEGEIESLDLEIYDGERVDASTLLFDFDGHLARAALLPSPHCVESRMFVCQRTLCLGGRQWTLVMSSTRRFEDSIHFTPVTVIAVAGMIASLSSAILVWSLLRSRDRAESIARSITADLQASEARMREASSEAQRLAEIARRTSNAIVITDVHGRVEWVNEGFTRISGYSLEEVAGKTPGKMLMGPKSDAQVAQAISEASQREEPINAEIVKYAKNGREYWTAIEIGPLRDAEGRLSGFMAIESDITELKRTSEQAEAASRAKSEFLANMSHEIRTPLTSILGSCDILREDGRLEDAPPGRLQLIDSIRRAGDHLLTVINDILDLSKIEAGQFRTEVVATSLPTVLREVLEILAPRVAAKGVQLGCTFDSPIPDVIISDPTHLRQILLNLVGNAVKFTDAGAVDVAVRQVGAGGDQPAIEIDVTDTGVGMTQEQAASLFRPFTQADASLTRKYGGTGLGLTISLRLAEFLGGSVTLTRTQPGKGSTFTLRFPLAVGENSAMATTLAATYSVQKAPQPYAHLEGRVLVAEDSPDIQRILKFHLGKAGLQVMTADNGVEALRLMQDALSGGEGIDLLVTDMQMPEMDGYSLVSHLRQSGYAGPIVALTAHAMTEDKSRCLEAGCNGYVTKPIVKEDLLNECAKWLSQERRAMDATMAMADSTLG